jgi:hypothetical protein
VDVDTEANTVNDGPGVIDDETDPVRFKLNTNEHGLTAGDLLRVDDEIMQITAVGSDWITADRAKCGTTIAAHVADSDVYTSDGVISGNIPVGLVDLTPAAASDALIATINDDGTEDVTAVDVSANEILLIADEELDLATDMTGVNNTVDDDSLHDGASAGVKRVLRAARVPNATEVALGHLHIPTGFTPTVVDVFVRVTATGAIKAWDGAVTAGDTMITLDNSGDVDWSENDTVYVVAYE